MYWTSVMIQCKRETHYVSSICVASDVDDDLCEYSTDCYHFPQDMALIEALWKQDVDLGVPREVFEEEGPVNNPPDPTKDKDHGKKVWYKFILYPADHSDIKDM